MNSPQILFQSEDKKGGFSVKKFPECEKFRQHVCELKLHQRPPIMIFGKICKQNRNVGFYSDAVPEGYKYNTLSTPSFPLTPELKELLDLVNKEYKCDFNGILVNEYLNGNDYVGSHTDKNTGPEGVVALCYGATRKFRIRSLEGKLIKDIDVHDGYIYHMYGNFNDKYKHEIPVQKKIKTSRISLTFRKH